MTNLKEKVRPVFYPNKGKKTKLSVIIIIFDRKMKNDK